MLLGNDAAVNYHGVPPNLLERESELCTYCSAICANYQSKIPEMIHRLRMSTISPTEKRNDLHLTTTGVGHAFRPSIPFPPADFKVRLQYQHPKFCK